MAAETEKSGPDSNFDNLISLLVTDQAILQGGFLQEDALAVARHIHAACAMLQAMQKGLDEACTLLEGWVAWKCPRKHRAEHDAVTERLRSLIA